MNTALLLFMYRLCSVANKRIISEWLSFQGGSYCFLESTITSSDCPSTLLPFNFVVVVAVAKIDDDDDDDDVVALCVVAVVKEALVAVATLITIVAKATSLGELVKLEFSPCEEEVPEEASKDFLVQEEVPAEASLLNSAIESCNFIEETMAATAELGLRLDSILSCSRKSFDRFIGSD